MYRIIQNLGGAFHFIGNEIGVLYKFVSKHIKESLTLILNNSTGDELIDYKIYGNSIQIPDEYTQVEYLQSNGTQYIDTGIKPVISDSVKPYITTTCAVDDISLHQRMWGVTKGSGTYLQFFNNVGQLGVQAFGMPVLLTQDTNKHSYIIDFANSTVKQDSTSTALTYANNNLDINMYLFARNNNGTVDSFASCKIYEFSYNDGTQNIHLIPCRRNSDNVLGMYDTVSGTFYTNAGTGTFTSGSDNYPTPDMPVEIESLGDNGKNLFNEENLIIGTLNEVGQYSNSQAGRAATTEFIEVKPLTDYAVQGNKNGESCSVIFCEYDADRNFILRSIKTTGLITTTATTKYIKFCLYKVTDTEASPITAYTEVQLEEGAAKTEYRPYKYIDVVTNGKNMFDVDSSINSFLNKDGTIVSSSTFIVSDFIKIDGNMIVSYDVESINTEYFRIGYYDANKNFVIRPDYIANNNPTISINTNYAYCRICINPESIRYTQIEKGTVATEYEPYIAPVTTTIDITGHEALRKVGDVSDYIDFERGKIVRNVGVVDMGSLSYNASDTYGFYTWSLKNLIRKSVMTTVSNQNIRSDKYKTLAYEYLHNGTAKANNEIGITTGTAGEILLCNNNYSTSSSLKNSLSGTKLYYQLETPVEEDITLPNIPTTEGTTVISFNNNPQPSNAWVKYYSSEA